MKRDLSPNPSRSAQAVALALLVGAVLLRAQATPANKAALERHYDRFLSKDLARCTTCHLPSANTAPENLDQFPHNPFGDRLRRLGEELKKVGAKSDIGARLGLVAREDADGDGVDNETEILLGHNPGDAKDLPTKTELAAAQDRRLEFGRFLASYHWTPFESVRRPVVPKAKNTEWPRNPIDSFIAVEHDARGLQPRPEAAKEVLLRRVYLDLIGLARLRKSSAPSPRTTRATPMKKWSTAWSTIRGTASDGDGTGWMYGAIAIGRAGAAAIRFATASRTFGGGAIGSWNR